MPVIAALGLIAVCVLGFFGYRAARKYIPTKERHAYRSQKACMHAFLMHCILKIDLVNQFAYIRCVEHCWIYLDSVSVVGDCS